MTQITEDYCDFETAKLLKEKGLDAYVSSFYDDEGKFSRKQADWNWNIGPHYSAPTLQTAMKWLREVHNCHIYVQTLITTDGLQGYCPFYTKIGGVFMWQNVLGDDYATAPTYEEACEAAIKYCLEKLI